MPEKDLTVVWEGDLDFEGSGATKCRLIRFGRGKAEALDAQHWVGERPSRQGINPFTKQPIEIKRGPWERLDDDHAAVQVYEAAVFALHNFTRQAQAVVCSGCGQCIIGPHACPGPE